MSDMDWSDVVEDKLLKDQLNRDVAATIPLTIGDILDLIAEPVDVVMNNARMWQLKDNIDLNAPVQIVGTLTDQSALAIDIAEDNGALGILEV